MSPGEVPYRLRWAEAAGRSGAALDAEDDAAIARKNTSRSSPGASISSAARLITLRRGWPASPTQRICRPGYSLRATRVAAISAHQSGCSRGTQFGVAEIDDDPQTGWRVCQSPALIGDRVEMIGESLDRIGRRRRSGEIDST